MPKVMLITVALELPDDPYKLLDTLSKWPTFADIAKQRAREAGIEFYYCQIESKDEDDKCVVLKRIVK